MIQVFITDDHTVVRQGVRNMLSIAGDIDVIGEASSGDELLQLLGTLDCSLLLLDITMPGISGVELIGKIKHLRPRLPILILSMHRDAQVAHSALRAGASGYITKDRDPKDLINAVRKVANGGRYLDADLAEQIVFEASNAADKSPLSLLSGRETDVLRFIAKGCALNDIAEQLHLSPKTVSTHKMKLMQKLGIQNNADLILFAAAHGLNG